MRRYRVALLVVLLAAPGSFLAGTAAAANLPASRPESSFTPRCPPRPGPAVLLDVSLYKEGHPGPRVIDYGQRQAPDELQPPPGVECRVLPDTAPVAQWIERPPPNDSPLLPHSPKFPFQIKQVN